MTGKSLSDVINDDFNSSCVPSSKESVPGHGQAAEISDNSKISLGFGVSTSSNGNLIPKLERFDVDDVNVVTVDTHSTTDRVNFHFYSTANV